MSDGLEEVKTILENAIDEVVGVLGLNIKSIEPTIRADHVYRLQARSYRRGFMIGAILGGWIVAIVLCDRNLEYVYQKNRATVEQLIEQRQQLRAERGLPALAPEDQ